MKKGQGPSLLTRLNIRRQDKEFFLENLSMQLAAGMDILQSVSAIQADMKSRAMRSVLTGLRDDIDGGESLSTSLERSRLLPSFAVSLVKIGEGSGRLAENLDVIILQQQKNRQFRSRIFSAMMYPVFVLGITVVVGIGIAWFILPRLTDVFGRLDVELPLVTRILVKVGDFFSTYGMIAVPVFIVFLLLGLYFAFIFSKTRFIGQWMLTKIPGIRKLLLQAELGRMGYILGSLLDAGLPIVEAVQSLADATTLHTYRKFYLYLQGSINDGYSLDASFAAYKMKRIMPTSIQQMIVASERSGSLPSTLTKIGAAFEEKTEITTKNLAVVLEPILLFIVWLGVIVVALAVVLPIYSLVGGINS